MALFGRKPDDDDPDAVAAQRDVSELLDRFHSRASVAEGGRMMLNPGQVLENIATAMERVDLDINTSISIEDDIASLAELTAMIQSLRMGPTLVIHVLNTALRIMAARYPRELVTTPLPEQYDLRLILPLKLADQDHEAAKELFNRRTTSAVDLTEDDVAADYAPLTLESQLQIFTALIWMYGTKVGAMKQRTGIE